MHHTIMIFFFFLHQWNNKVAINNFGLSPFHARCVEGASRMPVEFNRQSYITAFACSILNLSTS